MTTTHSLDLNQARPAGNSGATVWLTGLPSSGKSTIARTVAATLSASGRQVEILDGDAVRANLSAGLGFSKEDRDENVRRIGWLAQLLASHGVIVLAPVIAPYALARASVRELHESSGLPFLEVFVSTPLNVCVDRDVKGLYALQARGALSGLTGVDDPYEIPLAPDLVVKTHHETADQSAQAVHNLLKRTGLV